MHAHGSPVLGETAVTFRGGTCVCWTVGRSGTGEMTNTLSGEMLRKLAALEDTLGAYSVDGDNMHASLEALGALLETDKVFLYCLSQRPGGTDLTITRDVSVGYPRELWRDGFEDFVRGRGVEWAGYNALRPDPQQRDRVLRSADIARLTKGRSLEVEEILYRRLGIHGHDTMRALVCDGPSLLAWVGIVQPEKTTEQQRQLFTEALPAFRKRLMFERVVTEAALMTSALEAALEQIAGAAWVLSSTGRIMHANAAGRARIDADRDGAHRAVEASVSGAADPRLKTMPLRSSRGMVGHVVVEVAERAAAGSSSVAAARKLGLTPAQTRVLERVARGVSNATIAADLGVAERTVEAHVTAILVKAQVPSRAALIVQIFREAPAL